MERDGYDVRDAGPADLQRGGEEGPETSNQQRAVHLPGVYSF